MTVCVMSCGDAMCDGDVACDVMYVRMCEAVCVVCDGVSDSVSDDSGCGEVE